MKYRRPLQRRPKAVAARLTAGVQAFRSSVFPEMREDFAELAQAQNPSTLFISCADSRVVPEMITQTEPGELFVCRNIGNIVPTYGEMLGGVSAVIEYAVVALEVSDIVICGHSNCGAMQGLLRNRSEALAKMPTVTTWLRNAHAARSVVEATRGDLDDTAKVQALVEQNVLTQLQHLATHPSVAAGIASGTLNLHGWVYDIGSGEVRAYDKTENVLIPLNAKEAVKVGKRR